MSFEHVASLIMRVGKTSGRNDKIELLKRYAEVPGFKEIMQFIYNPYIHTGIAAAKLKKKISTTMYTGPVDWQTAILHFTTYQTGSDADVAFAKYFIEQQLSIDAIELAKAMVTKTLKIGVTETTLNSVYGDDFIPKIGIMRGMHYSDRKGKTKGPYIVTEKLDGARRILVKDGTNVTLYTRSGHVDEGLVDIEAEARYLPDGVYDGEALAVGFFESALALRQATNSIANSKGKRTGLTFNVFDMIPLADFKAGISKHDAYTRKATVAAMFGDDGLQHLNSAYKSMIDTMRIRYDFQFIKPVYILGVANTEEEIMAFAQPIWDLHFEGVMLNTFDGRYEISASPRPQLLKVKATEEFKLPVVDVFEGKGEIAGMLGGVILDYKGYRVKCGSGFNHQQRNQYWNNPELIIGKVIEGDSFGETSNQQGGLSLNCPIFKRIVGAVE